MSSKNILASKTFWMAFFIFVGSMLKITGVAEIPVDDNAAWMGVGISVIQVILRLVTKSEIVIK